MLITNAKIITWDQPNQILENQTIRIEDGIITSIRPPELETSHAHEEIIDAGGQYVMPGNICAHTHFYGALACGMAVPGKPLVDFPDILRRLWWPLDRSLTLPDVQVSAEVMLVEAIRHGTTTLIDHHASPNAIDGSLDVIAEAVEQSGVRAALCYEVSDRDGVEKAKAGIDENVRFIQKLKTNPQKYPRLAANFGLHASLTLSDKTLDACRQAAPTGVGFHIHAAEHESDQYDSLEKCGLRVIDRLQRSRILNANSIIAHAVHVDAREINLLAESGAWVTHQPRSNMNNGVGVASVESQVRAGVAVCLGTDGFSSTMWEEWKAAYLVQKLWNRDPRRMPATDIVDIAIYNNAALASSLFPEAPLGIIQEGAFADLIFVDYQPRTPLTPGNLPWHIIFGFHESMVTATIVAGKVLMRDRRLMSMDEEATAARARRIAPQVWKRYEQNVPTAGA